MWRLLKLWAQKPGFALGHEDATAYGVGWKGKADYSDIKAVCGSHPAVHGWDVFGIELGQTQNGDGVSFRRMRQLIQQAHARGGLNTISWHAYNPVSGGNAWDTSKAVRQLLPHGSHHAEFRRRLDRIADYFETLTDQNGNLIPLMFRPLHEHTGNWFWWARGTTTEQDYVKLWRLIADHFKRRGLSNLLWVYSPAGGDVQSRQDYLWGYPGDAYVDVLGGDYYWFRDSDRMLVLARLAIKESKARGKVAALTEFGPRNGYNQFLLPDQTWLTRQFFEPLVANGLDQGLAFALAWRNAREDHCFIPYPGHDGEQSLKALCSDPRIILERDLPTPPDAVAAESDQVEEDIFNPAHPAPPDPRHLATGEQ